jgi:putative ABC transport system permease protein
MRPPAPEHYRTIFGTGASLTRFFAPLTVMALRHLTRWPVRTGLTALGISMPVALLVTAFSSTNSVNFLIDAIFFRTERQDATLAFSQDIGLSALAEVRGLPGVLRGEAFRSTAVILKNGQWEKRLSLVAVPESADLGRILDVDLKPVVLPPTGTVLSERVAAQLHLRVGDKVEVELLRREHAKMSVPVSGIVQQYVGLGAYVSPEVLDRMMGNSQLISGVRIAIDKNQLSALYAAVKRTPGIASIALQGISQQRFRETMVRNIGTMTTVYVTLAIIITFGVAYNSARIQLSERARELASLRVFGFTRQEVSSVLFVELGVTVFLAQPLGWMLGVLFSFMVARGSDSDLFRIPFVVSERTFATASIIVLLAAMVSALIVRRRIDSLDLISVLKTRE